LNSIIKTELKKMPARRRDIFLMSRLGNKKYEEIASALSLSVKTVEAEMGKALKLLKKETGYTR
ncbi:MAG: sigma factor-like helix-turn-helix DNA-binding protein, partial [Bacteroidales bacterium]